MKLHNVISGSKALENNPKVVLDQSIMVLNAAENLESAKT